MPRSSAPWRELLCWLALGSLPACVSSSIADDVRYVRAAAAVERLPAVADREVDPVTEREATRLLAEPLDAEAAVRVALLDNRELRARLREIGVARGQLMQAGLLPNPRAEAELLPERNSRVELRVEYDLTRAVLAPLAARAGAPELDAARTRAAAAVVSLSYRVREGFYRLQAAEQSLAVQQRELDALAARHEVAQALVAAGNVAELDVATEEAAYERARVMVARRELEVATERERMQRLLGQHGAATAWRVRAGLPPVAEAPDVAVDLERRALTASLALRERRQRLEALARRAGWTRAAGWIPDVTVDVHGLHGDPDDTAAGPDDDWRFGAGVSLELPLFDRRQGTAASLEAEFDALLETYYGLAVDVRSAARDTRNRVVSAHSRARQYRDVIVPAQRRVSQQTLLQYNAMQVGIFQLLEARQAELRVELEEIETLREYWTAVAELGALLAGQHVVPASSESGGMEAPAAGGEEH
ncbi:MAG TPA: TolC family protein [Polyangiaceae bacterium]|nr:TolC family protein [Polyangiaceae bacterium]